MKHYALIAAVACTACGTELRPGLGTYDQPAADAGFDDPGDVTELIWPRDEPLPPEFDFPPWLTMPEPGRVVVGWRTVWPTTGRVRVTRNNRQWIYTSSENKELHHIDLGVLEPGAAYGYEVFVDGTNNASRQGVFATPGHANVRLVHMAEFHAPSNSLDVARFAGTIREFRPHLLVESGDMADSGSNIDHWRSYMQTSAPWISNVILLPAHSNHVNGAGGNEHLLEMFALPNNERWYATRFGPVEILSLESTFERDDPDVPTTQVEWIAQRTAEAHDDIDDPDFLLATWHYPACSSHYASRSTARDWVMKHFIDTFVANGGIDMVLVGHDKYYERSVIDDRIIHLQTNAGKLAPSTPGGNHYRCSPIRTNTTTRSLALINIFEDTMSAKVIDDRGRVIDSFAMDKGLLAREIAEAP